MQLESTRATTSFRRLRPGPEAALQHSVEQRLEQLFPSRDRLIWTAGSVPVGAGCPDLVVTTCEPSIVALTDADVKANDLLGYLRAVGKARSETISLRLRQPVRAVERALGALADANIIIVERGTYSLNKPWECILPEVITIEVKVGDWRRALTQAARNRIFAHRSFVALPSRVADRIKSEPHFREFGVGILSIDFDGEVRTVRRARRTSPKVWSYYYGLAQLAAEHLSGARSAVYSSDRYGKEPVS